MEIQRILLKHNPYFYSMKQFTDRQATSDQFFLLAGPCAIEGEAMAMRIAEQLVMKTFAPTVLDVTHSLQQPNQSSGVTGGKPALIETIARAGIAAGVDGLFMETHHDPSSAKSDGANMLPLHLMEGLLERLTILRKAVNQIS